MSRGLAVLGCALLVAAGSAACEPSDRNDDAHSTLDARVQARDAAHEASDHAPDTGSTGASDASSGASRDAAAERDASSGGPRDAGAARDARADARTDANCPPECFRAYTCATSCGAPVFNNGCCPCPAGTIDTIGCNSGGGGGYCAVPCTGAAPSPSVVEACQMITSERACQAYEASEFPYGCRWVTPATGQCPPLP